MKTRTAGNSLAEVAEFLKSLDRAAVTTHIGADGDAIGSASALVLLLRSLGVEAVFCHREEVPDYLRWLLPDGPKSQLYELPEGYELLIVDTSRLDRAGVEGAARLNLDHHEDNPLYGEYNYVDGSAAATAEVIARLFAETGARLGRASAEAIYAGIYTDTGGFRFRNVSPEAHELAANLLRAGVIPAEVDDRINRTGTVRQLKIVGVSLVNAERYGEALISCVTADDYRRTGATELDSKEAIDRLRTVAGVGVVAHIREIEDGGSKVSLRSESVDVGRIARSFGGGGHRLAAGYTSPHPPEKTKIGLIAVLKSMVNLNYPDGGSR